MNPRMPSTRFIIQVMSASQIAKYVLAHVVYAAELGA